MASTVRGQIDIWHFKVTLGKVTSLIDRLKYTCDVTRDPSSNRQLYQCINVTTVMDVSQATDNMWSRRLCRVVKRISCETYWILLGRLMTTHVSFEVTVPSTLIATNWVAQRSFTSVNMLIRTGERFFIIPCPVPEPDNCFALFYFVINACILHVIIMLIPGTAR